MNLPEYFFDFNLPQDMDQFGHTDIFIKVKANICQMKDRRQLIYITFINQMAFTILRVKDLPAVVRMMELIAHDYFLTNYNINTAFGDVELPLSQYPSKICTN